jgi:hypothetical protein
MISVSRNFNDRQQISSLHLDLWYLPDKSPDTAVHPRHLRGSAAYQRGKSDVFGQVKKPEMVKLCAKEKPG